MKKKNKKKKSSLHGMSRPQRAQHAKGWIADYEGRELVQKYRKKYGLATLIQAVQELAGLGKKFDQEYVDRIKSSIEKNREFDKNNTGHKYSAKSLLDRKIEVEESEDVVDPIDVEVAKNGSLDNIKQFIEEHDDLPMMDFGDE